MPADDVFWSYAFVGFFSGAIMSRFVRGICFTFLVAATFAARPAYSQQGVAWTWISVAQGAIAVCDNDLWTVAFNNYAGLMGLKGKP